MGYKRGDSKVAASKRLRVNEKFLEELEKDFIEFGAGAIRSMRQSEPGQYCRMVANLLPREFEITHENKLSEVPDVEIDNLIEFLRGDQEGDLLRTESGKGKTAH
jgi:hypothetical protein